MVRSYIPLMWVLSRNQGSIEGLFTGCMGLGFPKTRDKDYSIRGSRLGSPFSGHSPYNIVPAYTGAEY